MPSFSLKEYQAAYKAAFGPIQKQEVLKQAARDKGLSTAELVKLDNWAKKQDRERIATPV